jgi:hypothetical protein
MQRQPDSTCTIDHTTTIQSHHCQRPCRSSSPLSPQELPGRKLRRTCRDCNNCWSSCYLTARSDRNKIRASKRLTRRRINNPMWISRERRIYRKRLRLLKATQGNMLRNRLYDAVTLLRHCDSNRLTLLSTFVNCVPVNLFNSNSPQEWLIHQNVFGGQVS